MFVANTANGKSVVNNDSEPINDAVSRHIRPQIVHDISKDALWFGSTNSAVLDTITTSVMLTTHFNVKFNAIMAMECSCADSKWKLKNVTVWLAILF